MRIRILDALNNFLAKRLFGIRGRPQNATGHFLRENNGQARANTRARGDEYNGFEERGDAQHAAGGDAADVDLRGRAVDGAACEVAGAADDEGEAAARGVGYCGEAVPEDEWLVSEVDVRMEVVCGDTYQSTKGRSARRTAVPTTGVV
jgi:hypothetical protein